MSFSLICSEARDYVLNWNFIIVCCFLFIIYWITAEKLFFRKKEINLYKHSAGSLVELLQMDIGMHFSNINIL